jgi:Ca2+-binding EF-hand superfamily protein
MGNQQTARAYTEKDIEILTKASGKNENEIRQWYKEFQQQSNNTDRMNKRQFQEFYTKLKKNPHLQQMTDHIFRAFDTDHSGTIDFAEFIIAYIATSDGTKRQKFEYAFEVYDINNDQLIEKKEAKKILNLICRIIGLPEEDVITYTETVMLSFDTNQDKVLTKQEFIDGCLHDSTLGKYSNPFDI